MANPNSCCDLHRLLTYSNFGSILAIDKFVEFCHFTQTKSVRRLTRNYIQNPNNLDGHIYLFSGTGTRYLSSVAGQYITFQPIKENNPLPKWYPVVSTKLIPQTKSLIFLGKASYSLTLLLLISYYENYLSSSAYTLNAHMTEPLEISLLLYMILSTSNSNFLSLLGRCLAQTLSCHDNHIIQTFKTNNYDNSITGCNLKTIYSYFPPFLCLYASENNLPSNFQSKEWIGTINQRK